KSKQEQIQIRVNRFARERRLSPSQKRLELRPADAKAVRPSQIFVKWFPPRQSCRMSHQLIDFGFLMAPPRKKPIGWQPEIKIRFARPAHPKRRGKDDFG